MLIEDFEFGGMEHPGAVFYRQSLLLLPAEADASERMRRANLIAHETAHMWFGNLVTMRWFDDVWLKEVFANFMADRIVAAAFPDADHEAAFVLRHFPPAYAVDRTDGTHAIRQPLGNLAEAGELYDALIYHKAPVAIAALEREIGAAAMQAGLRHYLADFSFGNADWPELRERLQRETRLDLADWSRAWIETAGRPALTAPLELDAPARYGERALTVPERHAALAALNGPAPARRRAIAWITLYEDMQDGGIAPAELLTAAVRALGRETGADGTDGESGVTDELLTARLIEDLAEIFWRFLDERRRGFAAGPVERALWLRVRGTGTDRAGDLRHLFWLKALGRFATTPETLAELESIWRGEREGFADLPEALAARLALSLSLRRPDRANSIMDLQLGRTRDAERRSRLEFLRPALASDRATRDAFFGRLLAGEGRSLWAVTGLELLAHPLRAAEALDYIGPGIGHAARLRRRGDIFLPRQWLAALFSGQGSAAAAAIVRSELASRELPARLRLLILETADPVFRAAGMREDSQAT